MKPQRRKAFAESPDKLLWLALVERNTGRPASRWLEIEDPVTALDLELAVAYRLLEFDNKVAEAQARRIAFEVSKIFTGEGEPAAEAPAQSPSSTVKEMVW